MSRNRPLLSCLLGPTLLVLSACGSEAPFTVPPPPDPDGGSVAPGTFEPLAPGESVSGSVSSTSTRGFRIEVPGTGRYALVLENVGLDVTATAYTHSDRTGELARCAAELFSQACPVNLPAGPVFVEVTGGVFSSSFRFTLQPLVDEGTAVAPRMLPASAASELHTVLEAGTSYWSFSTTWSGGVALDLRTIDVVPNPQSAYRIDWFAGADFSGTPFRSCTDYQNDCVGDDMMPGTYRLRITNTAAKPLVMHAAAVRSSSEGARLDPVQLILGTPHAGGVDGHRRSFYSFTTGAHAGAYVFEFPLITPSYRVDILTDAASTTPVSTCTSRSRCVLSDLEPSTPYLAVVTNDFGGTYDLVVTPGLGEGTLANRVPLLEGVQHTGGVDLGGTSRYEFTPTSDGYFDLVLPATIDFFGDVDVTVVDPDGSFFVTDTCVYNPCLLGALEAGVTYAIDLRSNSFEGTLPMTIVREPGGDGTVRSPRLLAVGEDRTSVLNTYYGNDYRIDATGHAGPIGLVVQSSGWFSLTGASGSFLTECTGKADLQTCTFPGPFSGGVLDFHVARGSASTDLRLHVFDLAPSAGCEADARLCFDFEGAGTTMPPAITEPASSGRPFTVTTAAANLGTYGIQASTNTSVSCFQLTTPVGSAFAAFDLDFGSTGASDSVDVAIDGTNVAWFPPTTGGYLRRAVGFTPTSAHALSVCLTMTGNGSRHAYVDDLELH